MILIIFFQSQEINISSVNMMLEKCLKQNNQHLKKYKSAEKFFNPNLTWAPQRDFELCMALDRFNFVIRAESLDKNQKILKKIDL